MYLGWAPSAPRAAPPSCPCTGPLARQPVSEDRRLGLEKVLLTCGRRSGLRLLRKIVPRPGPLPGSAPARPRGLGSAGLASPRPATCPSRVLHLHTPCEGLPSSPQHPVRVSSEPPGPNWPGGPPATLSSSCGLGFCSCRPRAALSFAGAWLCPVVACWPARSPGLGSPPGRTGQPRWSTGPAPSSSSSGEHGGKVR